MHEKNSRERERIYLLFCILSLSARSLHLYDLLPVVIVLYTRTSICIYIYIFGIACITISYHESMHEKKKQEAYFVISLDLFCSIVYLLSSSLFLSFFPISGSTVEATITTTTTTTTTEETSPLGVTINNTTITTTEKMLIVNTGENSSDTNDPAPVSTNTENDNSNNNNY